MSTRDVEAASGDALGGSVSGSASTVSRVFQAIKAALETSGARDLSEIELEHRYSDASQPKMQAGAGAEPVLVTWGITVERRPVLGAIGPGATESTEAWQDFLRATLAGGRGRLRWSSPTAGRLIGAVDLVWPVSARQRCPIHQARNVAAKVPKHAPEQVKADFWAIWDIDTEPGDDSVAEARRPVEVFEAEWAKPWRSAVACGTDDLDHLVTYLRFPREHWQRIRHSPTSAERRSTGPDAGSRS